jgi:ABC-type multidrug transport system fused ATPase/permease subunit
MLPDSYRRVRKLLTQRAGQVAAAQAAGVIQSLLLLCLLVVGGLLLYLVISRGEVRIYGRQYPSTPKWLQAQVPARFTPEHTVRDSGLYPVVANNQDSRNPVHRWFARRVRSAQIRLEPLQSNTRSLLLLLAIAVGLILLVSLTDQLRKAWVAEAVSRVATGLRHQIHRQVYRRGQSALPTEGIGPVLDLFTRDVNEVRDGLLADIDFKARMWVLAVGLALVGFLISVNLSIFIIALGAFVWLIARYLNEGVRLQTDVATRAAAVQLALLQEDLSMLRTVRVYGMEGVDKRRFDEHLEQYRASDEVRIRNEGMLSPTTILLGGAATIIAICLLSYSILEDSRADRISVAAAFVLTFSLIALARPVWALLKVHRLTRRAGRAASDIFEYLEQKPELQQSVGAHFLPPLRDRITLENVSLDNPSGRPLLSGVSVEIPARARTAILSLDEEAKLALACLMPRLIDPKTGRVRMDGIDLRDVTLESLRAQVAMVLQGDLVFTDTVLSNIGLGDPSYGLPRIIEAAKIARAHHFIQDLPDGYETVIGPLGHYLRVDEQYRIALARAYLHDPSIVIIEEPNITLDEELKSLIDDTIARIAPGRTMIFLPHRLSTIRNCDRVVVLHNAKLEAAGSPRDLHSQSKLYRHIQYLEFNQFANSEAEPATMSG